MATQILVNIGSGNGLLPDGTKPLPEPMWTYHQQGLVQFTEGNLTSYNPSHQSLKLLWKFLILNFFQSSQGSLSQIWMKDVTYKCILPVLTPLSLAQVQPPIKPHFVGGYWPHGSMLYSKWTQGMVNYGTHGAIWPLKNGAAYLTHWSLRDFTEILDK